MVVTLGEAEEGLGAAQGAEADAQEAAEAEDALEEVAPAENGNPLQGIKQQMSSTILQEPARFHKVLTTVYRSRKAYLRSGHMQFR